VLRSFRDNDANGNGVQDEIPVILYEDDMLYSPFGLWGNAWGLHIDGWNEGFYPDADGKMQFDWIDPRAKEVLTFVAKLYEEKLLDQEFATRDYDSVMSMINQGMVGVITDWVSYATQESAVSGIRDAGWPDAKYTVVMPPEGKNGYKTHLTTRNSTGGHWGISRDCQNPADAMKLLDYIYASPEGILYTNYGIEGMSYTMENGKPKFMDFVKNNPELGWQDALFSIGAMPNVPYITQAEVFKDANSENAEMLDVINKIQAYVQIPMPIIMPTDEEAERLDALMADIETYRTEMIFSFAMGKTSLDKWDEYVSTMKSINIDEVLQIKQNQYDRFNK